MPVGREPGGAEEQRARAHVAAVVGKALDLDVGVAGDLDDVGAGEQLAKLHRHDSRIEASRYGVSPGSAEFRR